MSTHRVARLAYAVVVVWSGGAMGAPVDGAFTYQGVLDKNGAPYTGVSDFRFRLYDDAVAGVQFGLEHERLGVSVEGGLFEVTLDFGVDSLDGDQRWLEIDARTPADGGYETLSPRQPLHGAPYAIQTRGIHVDSLVNVGIGTTTPDSKLHVRRQAPDPSLPDRLLTLDSHDDPNMWDLTLGSGSGILFKVPYQNDSRIGAAIDAARTTNVELDSSTALVFSTSQNDETLTEAMRIDELGRVGVGTGSPTSLLDVNGQSQFYGYTRFYDAVRFNDGRVVIDGPYGFNPISHSLSIYQLSPSNALRSVNDGSGLAAYFGGDVEFHSGDLVVDSDRIRVPGAGNNTSTPVFVHVATEANSTACDLTGCFCYTTRIDHPLCNDNPSAILIVTANGQAGSGRPVANSVVYNSGEGRWYIESVFDEYFCDGQKFNVLVVTP